MFAGFVWLMSRAFTVAEWYRESGGSEVAPVE
jgi:hypothetical protein